MVEAVGMAGEGIVMEVLRSITMRGYAMMVGLTMGTGHPSVMAVDSTMAWPVVCGW